MIGVGPLAGVRVVELGGIGPGPHAGMVLADMGADVVRVRRPGGLTMPAEDRDLLHRGKRTVDLDVKAQPEALLGLVAKADVLLDCFRPGTCERLGIGPDDCVAVNPRLIVARITGWGQDGPLAQAAGHDITYIALSGALAAMGRPGEPASLPLNLVGDFGGGSMFLVTAVLAALIERERTGRGRVLDVAIVDGVNYLESMMYAMRAQGLWSDTAGVNMLDTGLPWYDVYECADGRYLAVGALENQFFAEMVALFDLDAQWTTRRDDPTTWPELRAVIAAAVLTRTRDEWARAAATTDACVAPVLDLGEAHEALSDRPVFLTPAEAGLPGAVPTLPYAGRPEPNPRLEEALQRWGVDARG